MVPHEKGDVGTSESKETELHVVAAWAHRTHLVGLIVELGASLEFVASQFAWSLLGKGPKQGEAVTGRMSLSQLLRLIEDLAPHVLPADLLAEAKGALRKARLAAQRRNEFAHSMWIDASDDDASAAHGRLQVNRNLSTEGEYIVHETPIEELVDASIAIQDAQSELARVWLDAGRRLGYIR